MTTFNDLINTENDSIEAIITPELKIKKKICFCGLGTRVYNILGEKALYCSKCRTPEMKNNNKKCVCGLVSPAFNLIGEEAKYCNSCKLEGMINVKTKLCECGKAQPTYNYPNFKKAICCIKCKKSGMVNVKDKKCVCGKAIPVYNYENVKPPRYCINCMLPDMIDIMNKNKLCGCDKKVRATFNLPGEKKAICCLSCKSELMVNVIDKKCKCGKSQPIYNLPNLKKAICCNACKTDLMIDVKNTDKLCVTCKKFRANFNIEGETKGKYCKNCSSDNMYDVLHKVCLGQNGICPLKQRGNLKYKGYCSACFSQNFPLDPLTINIRAKTKEIAVRDFINSKFEGFQHDEPMWTGPCDCTIRRRLDHRKLIGNTLLVIETDERQHISYDTNDEEIRYDDLYMAFSGKWIYIRFNPDSFINSEGVRKNPKITDRFNNLEKEINKQIKRIEKEKNKELLEIIYLYYNGHIYNK
jgi:hypothetical protein